MGGKEASRGFLYQGFACVLEALTDKSNWDKIYIEYPTANDKVDIALEAKNKIVKSIQVKSTINVFSKPDIITWLSDLIKDIESPDYELFLIGQCDKSAGIFIKSIEKYYNNMLDKEVTTSLNGFDQDFLNNKQIHFFIIPFEIDILEKIVRDSFHQYISLRNQILTFDQISFIVSATVNDQMISSTHGKGMDKKNFDEELEKRILLVADKYAPKRISISIKSLSFATEHLENEKDRYLSLLDKFNDRILKKKYDWYQDIYKSLENFLFRSTNTSQAFQLHLNTHSSIAFAAGRILNSKSGINIFPMQKTATNGTVLWEVKRSSKQSYSEWNMDYEAFIESQRDLALILNVTRNIHNDVVEFIKEDRLPIGRIINCTPDQVGATNFSIEDGTHASYLANLVYNAISGRSATERRGTLHIFASAPNAFMFFLGQNSLGFGKCVLYEYDYEQRYSCTYLKSIDFIN